VPRQRENGHRDGPQAGERETASNAGDSLRGQKKGGKGAAESGPDLKRDQVGGEKGKAANPFVSASLKRPRSADVS